MQHFMKPQVWMEVRVHLKILVNKKRGQAGG